MAKDAERMKARTGPDQPFLERLTNMDFDPVFVLGLHRSGTTLLCKLLSATECFNPVTAYHLIRYERLLADREQGCSVEAALELTRQFEREGLADRGIDGIRPTAQLEEEYGFLLGSRPSRMQVRRTTLPALTELCRKVRFLAENNKPILLRNPHDFSNFLYIRKNFPSARFIFIHRHPIKTLNSQVRALESLFTEKNRYLAHLHAGYDALYRRPFSLGMMRLCFCRFPIVGAVFLAHGAARAARVHLNRADRLPREISVSVKYEQLCADPERSVARILDSLGIKGGNTAGLSSLIATRQTGLEPCVKVLRGFVHSRMTDYFRSMDYLPFEKAHGSEP